MRTSDVADRASTATGWDEDYDLVVLGAYQAGRDRTVDDAVAAYPGIERVLRQRRDELVGWEPAVQSLLTLAGPR